MEESPVTEMTVPLEWVEDLRRKGPRGIPGLTELTIRGDWRLRAKALSSIGLIIRDDRLARRRGFLLHLLAGRVLWFRRLFAITGPHGAFVAGTVVNRLQDNSWTVRLAAALALGEIRDPRHAPSLRQALKDPYRPVRIAAAAALVRAGAPPVESADEILDGAEPAPEVIGGSTPSIEWIESTLSPHIDALCGWFGVSGAQEIESRESEALARLLAGTTGPRAGEDDRRASEIARYAHDTDTHYNLTKPFTPINRVHNLRMLNVFSALAENLQVPPGGLVLDLGGGAGWVSELLARFGYRTVTLDLATALLRIGQQRFAQAQLRFRPVAGDMTRLPLANGSVDAAIIIDALHHVPDVTAVFREVFRVLAPGGQFLVAEPGEGHSETEKSRGEDREHGVQESEIHIGEVVRHARKAGFEPVRILPHFLPMISFRPADLAICMTRPSGEWKVEKSGQKVPFDEFVVQFMLGHPTLIASKGARPVDSRAPHLLRAEIVASLAREGARVTGTVTIRNAGDTLWLRGVGEPGAVRLGVQLLTTERQPMSPDFARVELPSSIRPGEEHRLAVSVDLPDPHTPYVLKLDMVAEQVCWFGDAGSKPVYVRV